MKQHSTISLVAKEAGVTKATVSRALRNKAGVSQATRDRIMSIARDLNYWPSPTRQGSAGVYTGQLGFVAVSEMMPRFSAEIGGSYLFDMMEGCRSAAEEQVNGLVLCRMTWDQVRQKQMPAAMRNGQLSGIILRGWWLPELASWVKEAGVPCVLVDCDRFVENMPQVQGADVQAMEQVVSHLVSCGAKRIATITGDMEHLNSQERLAGMQMAMTRRGLDLPLSHIVIEHGFDEVSGNRGVQELLKRQVSFDALVCQNDLIALGAMRALASANLRVPEDVKVIGFDNMEFGSLPEVGLTTINPFPHKLGETGTRLLLEKLNGKNVDEIHMRVKTELVIRQSA